MVLGSLEDNRFKDSCTSEVKLLAKKDFTYESDKKQSYSLLITDSVPEINYIAKNNFSKVILETSNAKKAEMLLSGKVQLLSALSFENDGFVRLEPFLMTLLKENKVKIVDSSEFKTPCFLLLLNERKQEFAHRLMDAFQTFSNSSTNNVNEFKKIGRFDRFQKIENWAKVKDVYFQDNTYLKYKYKEINLNIIKNK
jgi:hypothetical protein